MAYTYGRIINCMVALLWYSMSYNCVRWGSALSEPFRLLAGVRQGGVLSPALFTVYVDDLLVQLNKFGCSMFGLFVGVMISRIGTRSSMLIKRFGKVM